MKDQELRELVNPVFNTAKSCVQLSAAAGDQDAQRLLDALGFPAFGAQKPRNTVPQEMHEQVRKLFPAYTILIETRFQAMNRLIERMKDRQIVDLPCGYTSRGIRMSREGRTYFGFDLPAVTDAMVPRWSPLSESANPSPIMRWTRQITNPWRMRFPRTAAAFW